MQQLQSFWKQWHDDTMCSMSPNGRSNEANLILEEQEDPGNNPQRRKKISRHARDDER